jgi:antitoxin VapB
MALNIRNAEAEQLAAQLAQLTGESKTQAVAQALRERLGRLRRRGVLRQRLAEELDEIALRCAALPVQDRRCADEILGYDDQGVPGR